ncbi:MAG TPA: hypothetical protein VFM48_13095 [Aquabacterium sp.]|nr:hypothetical protein [Aquabacterium sp.]
MSRSIRLLALVALLLASAWVLRGLLIPDDRVPVRLAPSAADERAASAATASSPLMPRCSETDLAAWTLPIAPDPRSPYVTLYSPTSGARRVTQGTPLSAQVVLERISPTEAVVACADGHARRVLLPPRGSSAPAVSQRHPAPLGN